MNKAPEQTDINLNDNINVQPRRQNKNVKSYPKSQNLPPIYYYDQNVLEKESQKNRVKSISISSDKDAPQKKILDDRNLDDRIQRYEISHNESQEEQVQNVTCYEKLKARKCLCIGTIIGVLIFIAFAIVVPILFSKKPFDNTSQPVFDSSSTDSTHSAKCDGVPQTVCNYIYENYNDTNQILSLIQTSRSLSPINSDNPCNATRQNLSQIYKNIFISVECLALNFPDSYIQVYQKITDLQFTTQIQVQRYLNMTQSFSGRSLTLTDQTELAKTCRFNSTNSTRRLQQSSTQISEKKTYQKNCSSNANSVLIFIDGIGYGPSARLQNILKIKQITSKNDSTKFDGGIVALGAWRIDQQIGFFLKVVQSYESYLKQNNSSVIERNSLFLALKSILNSCIDANCTPPQISEDEFLDLLAYYSQRSTQSFRFDDSFYQYKRHLNFVTQKIIEGKKVVLLAHGQGSAYANKLYELLTDSMKQNVKLVYIAPTVDSMSDGSTNYITNPNDTIISIISESTWTNQNMDLNISMTYSLEANMPAQTFDEEADLGSNHKLTGYAIAYKQEFTFLIVIAKISATKPEKSMIHGPITVSINWYLPADINLHLIEPDGSHVYSQNKQGNSGYLEDLSSTDKTQFYYTNCTIKTGNYTAFVHYSSGINSSLNVQTKVYAGSQSFQNSTSLTQGDILFFCSIQVNYDKVLEIYQFTIHPQ